MLCEKISSQKFHLIRISILCDRKKIENKSPILKILDKLSNVRHLWSLWNFVYLYILTSWLQIWPWKLAKMTSSVKTQKKPHFSHFLHYFYKYWFGDKYWLLNKYWRKIFQIKLVVCKKIHFLFYMYIYFFFSKTFNFQEKKENVGKECRIAWNKICNTFHMFSIFFTECIVVTWSDK